ncbi:unnamed protein product [Mytilus coruscus]|uniref:Mutator-like transposase domain-containing protein n=1 Tax=Mytilus coruscus TaxID=42192 RepID=A0A6J8BW44_MYTCO|nr:unnamed protein product [Mytilus coruscus]
MDLANLLLFVILVFPIGVDHEEEVQVLNSRNFTQWREERRVVELGILADGLRACAKCGLPLQLGHTTSILTCGLSAILQIPCSNTVCRHANNIPTGKRQERIWDANVKLATEKSKSSTHAHECHMNWSGSAKSMEADMVTEMVKDVGKKGVSVSSIVGDEDSTTIARLRAKGQ